MKRNRWGIAAAAVGIHICIGSVYAWSVLVKPVMEYTGASLQAVQWTFSIAIFFLGISAAFFGSFVERCGPSISGLVSTACFTFGMFGAALAVYADAIWLLYLSYGCIGGIGLGIGYITPVATLIKWFPNHRGFATGLAIMGFGFAGLIAGPVMQFLYTRYGLTETFLVTGLAYCIVMCLSALYLKAPPAGDEFVRLAVDTTDTRIAPPDTRKQFTAGEAIRTSQFYALWWMLFVNITCGIGLLSVASPMAQEIIGMTPAEAAAIVGIIGLVNGAGRLLWASVSDRIGRANTYLIFFVLQIGAFICLAQTNDRLIFQAAVLLIISCYGGGFAAMPAYLSDLFGTKELSNIHGKVLTAWAAAGIVGPLFISILRERTAGYEITLYAFAALFVTALLVTLYSTYRLTASPTPDPNRQ